MFLVIAIGGCTLDLLTKHWVFHWLGMPAQWTGMPANWVGDPRPHPEWWLWEGVFGIQTATNAGALFGLGHGYSGLFAVLSVLAGVGIVLWLFYSGAAQELFLTVALGCVMAGVCGNLYDRLGIWQAPGTPAVWPKLVRDWILIRYHGATWPNFNIADSLLVCGAALLLWHGFVRADRQAPSDHDATA